MAIGPGIVEFINTTCVEKALAEEWDGELTSKLDGSMTRRGGFTICILTLGLLAPLFFEENFESNSKRKRTQVNDASLSVHHIVLFSSLDGCQWSDYQQKNSTVYFSSTIEMEENSFAKSDHHGE